jgi:hypothetical protein
MLVTCPKCGFNQPKDRYCANCGVNMETFHKKEPSLSEKILAGPLPFIIVLAIIGGLVYLRIQRAKEVNAGIESSSRVSQVGVKTAPSASPLTTVSPSPSAQESPASDSQDPSKKAQADARSTPGEQAAAAGVAATAAPAGAEAPSGKVAGDSHPTLVNKVEPGHNSTDINVNKAKKINALKVTYFEVPSSLMSTIVEENQGSESFGRQGPIVTSLISKTTGMWPQSREQFRVLRSEVIKLDGKSSLLIEAGENLEGEKILSIAVEVAEFNSQEFKGNVEVRRSSLRPHPATSFPLALELGPDSGFFISGILPRLRPPEMVGLTGEPLTKIFKSPQFQRGGSDFVIFIELSAE